MELNYRKIEPYLPALFKYLNHGMVLLWKLGLGRLLNIWPAGFGRILVMRHFGRASGEAYLTPVNYTELNGAVYVVAGFGSQSDWYQNLMANPHVEVWMPDGWYMAQAQPADEEAGRMDRMRAVLTASGFAAPLFGIYPRRMEDMELEAVTRGYKLVKLTRQAARTGADGPGSLAWLWPLILAACLLRRRRK